MSERINCWGRSDGIDLGKGRESHQFDKTPVKGGWESLCEDVGDHVTGGHPHDLKLLINNEITNVMEFDVVVLRSLAETNGVVGNSNGRHVILEDGGSRSWKQLDRFEDVTEPKSF